MKKKKLKRLTKILEKTDNLIFIHKNKACEISWYPQKNGYNIIEFNYTKSVIRPELLDECTHTGSAESAIKATLL